MGVGTEAITTVSIPTGFFHMKTSALSEFYKKPLEERVKLVQAFADLSDEEVKQLLQFGALDFETANRMIENVFSTFGFPLGIATNFIVNQKEILVPMALEEPSVVAAASNAARLARPTGGFVTDSDEPVMIGQIQLVELKDAKRAKQEIQKHKQELLDAANAVDATLVKFGGGVREIDPVILDTQQGDMLVVDLLVDVRDAMGANAINTIAERLTPRIEELSGGKARLRIISNLAVHRKSRAKAVWKKEDLAVDSPTMKASGDEVVQRILEAYAFADADPFRACTHNKGIMNGIDAVAIATGQDFRALEAGAHTYAWYKTKTYKPLTQYYKDKEGNLVGEIELPTAVGIVGGAIKTHPIAKISMKLLGAKTARELGEIIAAVGLAQNFAAMRALATEGIQKGHMRLHARNIAVAGGATGKLIDTVAEQMIKEGNIRQQRAEELVKEHSK